MKTKLMILTLFMSASAQAQWPDRPLPPPSYPVNPGYPGGLHYDRNRDAVRTSAMEVHRLSVIVQQQVTAMVADRQRWESPLDKVEEVQAIFETARFTASADVFKQMAVDQIAVTYFDLPPAFTELERSFLDMTDKLRQVRDNSGRGYLWQIRQTNLTIERCLDQLRQEIAAIGARPPRPPVPPIQPPRPPVPPVYPPYPPVAPARFSITYARCEHSGNWLENNYKVKGLVVASLGRAQLQQVDILKTKPLSEGGGTSSEASVAPALGTSSPWAFNDIRFNAGRAHNTLTIRAYAVGGGFEEAQLICR